MMIVNTVALFYTFWSVWYQAKVAKQWCPLCIAVQIVLWCLFLVYFIFGLFYFIPDLFLTFDFALDILFTGFIYVSTLILIDLYLSVLIPAKKNITIDSKYKQFEKSQKCFLYYFFINITVFF
jgi:uncharacterized membrane protein YhaH (DUF805 family)